MLHGLAARAALTREDLDGATEHVQQALAPIPETSMNAWVWYCVCREAQADVEAEQVITEPFEENPGHAPLLTMYGR